MSENPLSNVEVEQSVLGALLLDNHNFIHVGQLSTKHFYEPLHKDIFTAITDYWSRGQRADALTLRPLFESHPLLIDIGGAHYLVKLLASLGSFDLGNYSTLLIDLAHRRALLKVVETSLPSLLEIGNESPAEKAMSIYEKISSAITDMDISLFQDDFEITESIINDMKRDVRPYKTGYEKLDLAMDGGLHPGKSYGFAARKKVGKTILGGSISHNLNERGIRHLFICGEMSPAEVQKRTLARQMQVKQAMFNCSQGKHPSFMKRIAETALTSKRAVIYKNAPGLTFEDLKRYVLLARMQKKITGFILDYWQLVGGKAKGKSTAEHLDEVAQWIADTCRKYDLWSITMAQINQEGNTRGGEGIRLAFDQVYVLQAPNDDAGRKERWLEMSDTRYTAWRSVGSQKNPGFYLNEHGPYFSETYDECNQDLGL